MAIPHTQFSTTNRRIVHSFDFLPDWLSFSGMQFQDSLHVDFVNSYLRDSEFDYRTTTYYKRAVKGNLPFPCYGTVEAGARCRQFINLIDHIEQDGYQPDKYGPITFVECIDGATMVLNGKHRLSILMALGVREFPAVVCFENEVRAKIRDVWARRNWPKRFYGRSYRLYEKVGRLEAENQTEAESLIGTIKQGNLETRADIYHPIPFYEFRNLKTELSFDTPYQRLGMILSLHRDLRDVRVLDLGCNVGFNSLSLAKRGATVTGIDLNPNVIDIASNVARMYGIPITFLNTPLTLELIENDIEEVDVTVCFSMLHRVIAQKGMDYGKAVLRAVSEKSRSLFFDISVNSGQAGLMCRPGEERSFAEGFLREATIYPYITHVGEVQPHGTYTSHVFYGGHSAMATSPGT